MSDRPPEALLNRLSEPSARGVLRDWLLEHGHSLALIERPPPGKLAESKVDADANAYTDAYAYADTDTHAYANADAYAYADAYTDCAVVTALAFADAFANA